MTSFHFFAVKSSALLLTTVLLSLPLVSLPGSVPLVKDGLPVARIYLEATPEVTVEPEPFAGDQRENKLDVAIEEWNYHLEKMSGARLEVVRVDDPKMAKRPAVVLGGLAKKMGAVVEKTQYADSYRLQTKDGVLLVAGETQDATLNGIYDILGRLGCDWVMPGKIGEIIPSRKTVVIDDVDEVQKPDFYHRNLWYSGGPKGREKEFEEFRIWKRRQRMGAGVEIAGNESGHVWGALIQRHKEEFEADPTMYALVRNPDGSMERKGPQIEPTHHRVIELFAEEIQETFAKNKWPKDKAVAFGIGPADGLEFSESADAVLVGSGRKDPLTGCSDETDALILLGNTILKKIQDEYPNVRLGYYSYSVHADYPLRYRPLPQISQVFAPITYSRYHSLEDSGSKTLPYYRQVLEQWARLGKEQGNVLKYRGYNWTLAEGMVPYSQLHILGDNIPFYYRNGVRAVNIEAQKAWAVNGPHDYLLAKLLWNVRLDWQEVVRQYCQRSFGAGAPFMETYFMKVTERQRTSGQEAGSFFPLPLIYDRAFVLEGEKDLAAAEEAAEWPEEKERVRYFKYPLRELKDYLAYHDAVANFDFVVGEKLYQQMKETIFEADELNPNLMSKLSARYLERFLKKFVEQGKAYSTESYEIVYQIPDELPTILDPFVAGDKMNFQGVDIDDSRFIRTKTFGSTWDAQGLGALEIGAVWYRIKFSVSQPKAGETTGLFLGGFDDEARVWLNGEWIGSSGVSFSNPSVFDLGKHVRYGKENVLAVMVVRNGGANEIGVGGILRPSFIFQGPPLAEKVPAGEKKKKVLPGGAEQVIAE